MYYRQLLSDPNFIGECQPHSIIASMIPVTKATTTMIPKAPKMSMIIQLQAP